MFSFIYARMNGWVNNRMAGDLRRHCAHYDVTVLITMRVKTHDQTFTSVTSLNVLHSLRSMNKNMIPRRIDFIQKPESYSLTDWGRATHICVGNLTIIGSDNGLSPCRHQAINWTSGGLLLIGSLGINFSKILIEIHTFSYKENAFESVVCKMAYILYRPQCVNTLWPEQHGGYFRRYICLIFLSRVRSRGSAVVYAIVMR